MILERRFGVRPQYIEEADALARARAGAAALLIGDAAIDAIETFPPSQRYDLGTLWHEWTGLQTVFAVWAARRDVVRTRSGSDRRVHARFDRRVHLVARASAPTVVALAQRTIARPEGFYEHYYGKLNFMFHVAAQNGLAAYCRELVAIGAIASCPSRWSNGRMPLANLLDRAAGGGRLTFDEGVELYEKADLHELGAAAHARRMAMHDPDVVTYVVDTTINYTNVCNVHCTFCAFFRPGASRRRLHDVARSGARSREVRASIKARRRS